MKNLTLKPFTKNLKKNNLFLGIAIILLIATISCLFIGYQKQTMKIEDALDMNTLDVTTSKEGKHAFLDITSLPYLFASYETNGQEEDGKLYLVMDKDNFLYIVYMPTKEFDRVSKEVTKNETSRTIGTLRSIDVGIKDLAISSYNEEIKEDYLTNENFQEYVGIYYLDTVSPLTNYVIFYVMAIIIFIIFFIFMLAYLLNTIKTIRSLKKFSKEELEKIESEIYALGNNPNEELKLYLTHNYLIDVSNGIIILRYEDIIWAYPYEYRYNGLIVNKNIRLVDKNNKTYDVCNTKILKEKDEERITKVLKVISEKNKNILIGKTKENQQKIKEMKKNNQKKSKKV